MHYPAVNQTLPNPCGWSGADSEIRQVNKAERTAAAPFGLLLVRTIRAPTIIVSLEPLHTGEKYRMIQRGVGDIYILLPWVLSVSSHKM